MPQEQEPINVQEHIQRAVEYFNLHNPPFWAAGRGVRPTPVYLQEPNMLPNDTEFEPEEPEDIVHDTLRGAITATTRIASDTYALNDDTGVGDWRFQELPKKKKDTIKVVQVDKVTLDIVREITEEIINENLYTLKDIYTNRLDFIENNDYNGLLESVPNPNTGYERVAPESASFRAFETTIISWAELSKGDVISNHGSQGEYLIRLEEKAKQRYSIEHSKYKYYPRLKGTVKYGNLELLAKILTITQIGKGKVICSSQS